jgi:hypothetical protein
VSVLRGKLHPLPGSGGFAIMISRTENCSWQNGRKIYEVQSTSTAAFLREPQGKVGDHQLDLNLPAPRFEILFPQSHGEINQHQKTARRTIRIRAQGEAAQK